MTKAILSIILFLFFSNHFAFSQTDSAFCAGINLMLEEMKSDFVSIKGDIYSGYQGDEYMATKKLPGAIEARIPDSKPVVCQNIFLENESSKETAFTKYEELVKKFEDCMGGDWTGKDLTKIQDREKKNYKFTKEVGDLKHEIVITAWKQFNGFTVTVRFSKR